MLKVCFQEKDAVEDELYRYAVIVSRAQGKWIFVKHRQRDTWEIPGGRREPGEEIEQTARRELYEETGALRYALEPLCAYYVQRESPSYGLLCFAEVEALGPLPETEIERVECFDGLPELWTYPEIQPVLLGEVKRRLAL